MPQDAGTTLVNIGSDTFLGPAARAMQTVQQLVSGRYEVLGELGRGVRGRVVYLAREQSSKHLVALQFTPPGDGAAPAGGGGGAMWLEVLRRLDASVPGMESACPSCGTTIRGWMRYCGHCGTDVSGIAPSSSDNTSPAELLEAVRKAAGSGVEVLGQMDQAEGGGLVYFAREVRSGNIMALRLRGQEGAPPGGGRYRLGRTQVITSLVAELEGAGDGAAATITASKPGPGGRAGRGAANGGDPERGAGRGREPSEAATSTTGRLAVDPAPVDWRAQLRGRGPLLAALAVALALVVGVTAGTLLVRRRANDAIAAANATADSLRRAVPPPVDSAQVQIGGALPAGARVTVDGKSVSGTAVKLPPGHYAFRVSAPGRRPSTQEFDLTPGQQVTWTPQLVRAR